MINERRFGSPETMLIEAESPTLVVVSGLPKDDSSQARHNDHECGSPVAPDPREARPEQAVSRIQLEFWCRALKHANLMTQSEDLQLQGGAG